MNYIIRKLERKDIPHLADFPPASWNFNIIDFFELYYEEPYFFPFVVEKENEIVACAESIINGKTAWLGMIIVREDQRRQAIGTTITQHMVDYCKNQNAESILLAASPMGERLYSKLRFGIFGKYEFYRRDYPTDFSPNDKIRPFKPSDFEKVIELDRQVSGEDRSEVFKLLVENGYVYSNNQMITGFFLPGVGNGAVISNDDEAGIELLKFKHTNYHRVTAVPVENVTAKKFLLENGFEKYNDSLRMVWGENIDWKPGKVFCRISGYLC